MGNKLLNISEENMADIQLMESQKIRDLRRWFIVIISRIDDVFPEVIRGVYIQDRKRSRE